MPRNGRQRRFIDRNSQIRDSLRQEFRNQEPFQSSLRWRVTNIFHMVSFSFFCCAMQLHLLQPSPLIILVSYSPVDNRIEHLVLVLAFVVLIKSYFSIRLIGKCQRARQYTRLLSYFAIYAFAQIIEGMILINFPNIDASNWIMTKLKKYGYHSSATNSATESFTVGVRIFSSALGLSVANLMALLSNYTLLHNFKREFRHQCHL